MTVLQWLGTLVALLTAALIVAAGIVMWRRRQRAKLPPETGWLTDDLLDEILREGRLEADYVPDEELDLKEIRREEDRFWSESWDEPDPYFE